MNRSKISAPRIIAAAALSLSSLVKAEDFQFPSSITCTVEYAVTASVQTGVVFDNSGVGYVRKWQYIGEERYEFIYEGQEVVFSTRLLNSGSILELMRDHTTYSVDLQNDRYVMIQAMAGDPEIPNPAIGGMDSGPCSISTDSTDSHANL